MECVKIDAPDEVLELFQQASRDGFWGTLVFTFQSGRLMLIKKEATIKVNGIKFPSANLT